MSKVAKKNKKAVRRSVTRKKSTNPHVGGDFNEWLAEEGILEEVSAAAQKRVFAELIKQEMEKQAITPSEMARRMSTSRSQVLRIIAAEGRAPSLKTLVSAAAAVGKELKLDLV